MPCCQCHSTMPHGISEIPFGWLELAFLAGSGTSFRQGRPSLHWISQIWVFPKILVPPISNFNRIFHYKPSILGFSPYFWKHPYIYIIIIYNYIIHPYTDVFMISCPWPSLTSSSMLGRFPAWDVATLDRWGNSGDSVECSRIKQVVFQCISYGYVD